MRVFALVLAMALLAGCAGQSSDADDTDGDGVDDAVEREGRVITITTLTGIDRRTVTGDPGVRDADGDGIPDGEEMLIRATDPHDVDTDDDGLLDGHDTLPRDDATRDAMRAAGGIEANGTFLGELDACPAGGQLKPNVASSDAPTPDQLADGEEVRGWDVEVRGARRHVTSDPCKADTDADGLADHLEKELLSDPRLADTDGDGARDGSDADPLHDLALRFLDLHFTRARGNDSAVRITLALGDQLADLSWPGNGTATLEVSDLAPSRESLEVRLVIAAEERATGKSLDLFDDPRGAILTFDLLEGSVEGAHVEGDTLRFEGADGSFTLRWAVARR